MLLDLPDQSEIFVIATNDPDFDRVTDLVVWKPAT